MSTPDPNNPQPLPTDPAAISQMANPPQSQGPTQAPPVAQPTEAPQTGQPTPQPQGRETQEPQNPHVSLYSKILKSIQPPPMQIVAPDGSIKQVPQTRGQLGRTVISAVLAGMMTPNVYREGAFGQELDTQATGANAFKAGMDVGAKQQQDAQALSDKQQAEKLNTVKANVDMMHLWAATSHEMGQDAQQQVDNYAPTLKIANDHDQNLQTGDTKAVLASGMTMKEALQHPEFRDAMTKHTLFPDGVIEVDDGHGHMVPTQTFSVIDPNVQVSLDKDAVDVMGKINPQWRDIFNINGSMKARLGQIQAVTNQVNSVQYAERIFNDAANSDDKALKALGLKGDINNEIMSAVRNGVAGSSQAMKSLMIMENAKAAGGTTVDALDRLVNDADARAGSAYILNALGTTADKVSKFVQDARNEQTRQTEIAKSAGKLALQKAKPITFATAAGIANDPNETPDRVATANAVILAHQTSAASTAAAVAKAKEPFELRKQMQEQALKTGSPADAGKLLANGDLTLTELKSRGSTPDFIIAATNAAKAVDPKYNAQKADAEYKIASNQANTTFFGSANSLLDKDGTLDQLAANYAKLGNMSFPWLNKWQDYVNYEAGDPAMAGFMQTALGVADDYAKVMGGGTGSDTSREQVLHSFANAHNPEQMQAAIDAARKAVQSQTKSRMGSNSMLRKMYSSDSTNQTPHPKSTSTSGSTDPFAQFGGKVRTNVQ